MSHEQFFDVNQNATALTDTFSQSSVFFPLSLHQTTKEFIACASCSIDWLANFSMWANTIGFFEFYLAHSEILLTAWADQLLYNLSLIKLCLTWIKQNTAVKTASDSCSILAK